MILLILILASIIVGMIAAWKNNAGDDMTTKVLESILYSIMGSLGTGLVFFFALAITTGIADVKYTTESSYKIFALQDNQSVGGSFFLGSGSFDGTMKYVYMLETNDGYLMQSVETDAVTIRYSDNPKIETFKREFTNKTVELLFFKPLGGSKQIISIPEGSIKNGYNVDLQ